MSQPLNGNGFAVRGDGVFEISGRMTFQTVPELVTNANRWLADSNGAVTIDLGKVALADSAGVALLLEWVQQAQAARRDLKFVNFPDQVKRLINVSGLNQVFGVT